MSIALVTGASRGIGRACALALAKRGYDVAVNYVSNEAAAQAVVAEIQALGVRSLAVRANTAELPEVKDMFRTVVREMGGLDVLVNNAGVVDDRYLMMLTEDSLTRSLDINIKGYFHCAQQAALKMFKKKSGVIVNISSVSSVLAIPGQSVYSATKGAVNALTATLAKELAPYGIRVNAVAPGFVETEMLDHIPQEQREGYLKSVPYGPLCQAGGGRRRRLHPVRPDAVLPDGPDAHPRWRAEPVNLLEINARIRQRPPFQMIERVTALEPGKSADGIKCVSVNEPYFQGHMPGLPIMPGVLLIESAAQLCSLVIEADGSDDSKVYVLLKVRDFKFVRPVVPGDRLEIHAEMVRGGAGVYTFDVTISCDGGVRAKGELMFTAVAQDSIYA